LRTSRTFYERVFVLVKPSLKRLTNFGLDSEKFVTEVFEAVKAKSYVPGYVAPSTLLATAPSFTPSFNPPSGPSSLANTRPHASGIVNGANGGGFQSKKRTYHEHVGNENHEPYVPGGGFERSTKQMRRGGRGEQRGGNAQMPSFPGNPLMNPAGLNLFNAPGIPALDPTNPMSAFLAFQAMNSVLGLPPVPMPGVQSPVQSTFGAQGGTSQRRGKRCFDYDSKGFCARGGSCPYDHGIDYINNVVGANSQPIHTLPNPSLTGIFPINDGGLPLYNSSSSGNQEQQNRSGRGGRAPFSAVGRNMDRSITTIVVESIPEENFTEEAVKEYFGQFGNITEVTMQPYKRLALVKFDDYWAARNAYESPKTIFDNRFVKVYWYKPTGKTNTGAPAKPDGDTKPSPAPSSGRPDTEMTDPVEIEKKLADAQKAHEEKQRKLEEARTQKADLDEQMRKQAEERKKLLDAIAAKEKKKGGQGESTIEAKNKNDAFDALKAKVAMLEAEAESLGFDPNESNDELQAKVAMLKAEAESLRRDPNDAYNNAEEQGSYGYRGRGRGGYRGRGRFFSRARGAGRGNFGGYRGRGAPFGGAPPGGGGTVMRLDNRPKKVRVGIGPGSPQDEALRQYLFVRYALTWIPNSKFADDHRMGSSLTALLRTPREVMHKLSHSRSGTWPNLYVSSPFSSLFAFTPFTKTDLDIVHIRSTRDTRPHRAWLVHRRTTQSRERKSSTNVKRKARTRRSQSG
jgi:RNA recognition motif-containing protein